MENHDNRLRSQYVRVYMLFSRSSPSINIIGDRQYYRGLLSLQGIDRLLTQRMFMAVTSRTVGPSLMAAAVCTPQNPNIPVCGPFITPSELWRYVIDGSIVTRSELLPFYEDGKLSTENMAFVLSDLRRLPAGQG